MWFKKKLRYLEDPNYKSINQSKTKIFAFSRLPFAPFLVYLPIIESQIMRSLYIADFYRKPIETKFNPNFNLLMI